MDIPRRFADDPYLVKTHIALLRGINVGGNKKLPMADLRAFIENIGFKDARTLLQSGNLVFRSDGKRDDAALETFLDDQALKHLGLSTKFLVRTASEWAEVIARNPFPEAAQANPGRLLVMFFRAPPTTEAVQSLRASHDFFRTNSSLTAGTSTPIFPTASATRRWPTP